MPKSSSVSSVPGTPGLDWSMNWVFVPGPFAVPKVTRTPPPLPEESGP
ncbi:hypothetical protein [Streptomyces sp. NPDC093060]